MKVLTLTQPWATLVAIGAKQIETRSWRTYYRGPLAVHAAVGFPKWAADLSGREPFYSVLSNALKADPRNMLPLGAILCVCNLTACKPTESIDLMPGFRSTNEYAFGDYSPNRWMWLLEDVRRLQQPIPVKGALGLWGCDDPRLARFCARDVLCETGCVPVSAFGDLDCEGNG